MLLTAPAKLINLKLLWINGLNYRENIEKTKWRAHLILEKGRDHSIQQILMRKI